MRKELKDQIKQDELTTGLEQAAAWAARHRDELRIGGLVLLVLAGAALAITHVREQRLREGDRALRDALTTFEAPVASELPPGAERPAGQVFPSAEEKYKTAAAAFEGVARRYPSSTAGVRATYFGALPRLELGQYAEAEKALKELQPIAARASSPTSRGWRSATATGAAVRSTRPSKRSAPSRATRPPACRATRPC